MLSECTIFLKNVYLHLTWNKQCSYTILPEVEIRQCRPPLKCWLPLRSRQRPLLYKLQKILKFSSPELGALFHICTHISRHTYQIWQLTWSKTLHISIPVEIEMWASRRVSEFFQYQVLHYYWPQFRLLGSRRSDEWTWTQGRNRTSLAW
jgi:hypothetical protein